MNIFGISTGETPKKPAKAGANEDMDILDKLHQEHELVKSLTKKLVDSRSSAQRTSLLKQVKLALVPHARAEEKVVYDAVGKTREEDAEEDRAEGYIEHHLADEMVLKLSRMRNKTSAEFTAAAKVLKELLEHHIQEEESNIWPRVKDNFSDDEREEMNRKFEAAKKKVKIP